MRLSRPAPLGSLSGFATAALIGCQQLLITTATVTTPAVHQGDATLAFQRREDQKAPVNAALYMPAATQTGQFEDAFKPVPTPAPAPVVVEQPAPVAVAEEPEPEQEAAAIDVRPLLYETGIASTYGQGDGFEGLRTSCGHIFHTHFVQVAPHRGHRHRQVSGGRGHGSWPVRRRPHRRPELRRVQPARPRRHRPAARERVHPRYVEPVPVPPPLKQPKSEWRLVLRPRLQRLERRRGAQAQPILAQLGHDLQRHG